MDFEALRFETIVREDGKVDAPGVHQGERVEVTLRRLPEQNTVVDRKRLFGWLKGKIHIRDDFDDPIPGMEDYT